MINSFFILQLCLLPAVVASAATSGELRGCVVDAADGTPVAGAVIKAKGAFTSSNAEGRFVISINSADADSVTFRCIGYETMSMPVNADFSQVKMERRATVLKDVIVAAPDIYARGDTLVFNVERFANATDDAIIDVIKRLPGIKVLDDGTIEYQGKPINKFYIDGKDFLNGRYGLATENISHKDVKQVEVMENHQPVKALEGIEFTEEAGINLKLKDDARSRWVGVTQAASGASPWLYDASGFTMRIAPAMQNMFTLKGDNTGWNPASQIMEHDYDFMFGDEYDSSPWPDYISADAVNAPLAENRTLDNHSWLANAISAWGSDDTSMRLNLNYAGDRLDYTTGVTTDYMSPSIAPFVRHSNLHTRSHDIQAGLHTEVNKRSYFLKDRLTVSARQDCSRSLITGSYDLSQHVTRRQFSVDNNLKLAKRTDRKLFTLTSRNSFEHSPDRLSVGNDAGQRVSISDFRSTTESELGRMTRFWKYSATLGADINLRRMSLSLNGYGRYDNLTDYDMAVTRLYATPRVDYDRRGWRWTFAIPLKWIYYHVNGNHNYASAAPRFYIKRQLTSRSHVSGSAKYSLGAPAAYMFVNAPVLNDFRNIFIGAGAGRYEHALSLTADYSYRNPLDALFVTLSGQYSRRQSPYMSDQLFTGDIIVTDNALHDNDITSWSGKASASKGLGHGRFVIGAESSVGQSHGSAMRDGERYAYRQLNFSAGVYGKGSLAKWLTVNYDLNYKLSGLEIDSESSGTNHNVTQNMSVSIIPSDLWHITAALEHYHTRFPGGSRANLALLDAETVWNVTGRVRLSLTARNLLDNRQYRYLTYGTLTRTEHTFALRGRTVLATLQLRF